MVVLCWQLHLHRQGNNSLTTLAQTPLAQPPPGLTPQQQALLAEGLWWSAADLTRALGSVAEFKKLRGKRQNLWDSFHKKAVAFCQDTRGQHSHSQPSLYRRRHCQHALHAGYDTVGLRVSQEASSKSSS